ncbi:phage baseplate assembly protein V [Chitinibacter sp. S2-10]|uniref:phage baseplate assembly protein V n=1 Tax=Chitinibacter sp. S2-10 TaxID=3373597 RepID=UPI0039778A36
MAKMLAPLSRQIGGMVTRGVVALVNSARKMQSLQLTLLADEPKDNIEHFEPYGFTANPKAGAESLALFLGGDRSHGVVIACADRRYRLKGLDSGEVAIYDDQGQSVILKRGKICEINTDQLVINAATRVQINSPEVKASGNVIAVGDVADQGGAKTMAGMRAKFNPHSHGGGAAPNQVM